ncbi:MAG: hypothetical protein KC464_15970 [Myxococcales bacterium]|nr:hypothetical protein [Myxococcales bacterium]
MSDDEWTRSEPTITEPGLLAQMRRLLDEASALIVEHRVYRGAREPRRFVCTTPDELDQYLRIHARPGDSFYLWAFEDCCRDDNHVAYGKVPDADGRVPRGGAY